MLCLFDLDGTLIDSEHGIIACVKHALAKLDVPAPPQEELRGWIGPPLRHSFAPLLDHDPAQIEAAVEYYHERFHTDGWREHDIYPGIETLIERLLGVGHQLAVVTSKPQRHAAPIITHLPFGDAFLRLYGPDPNSAHSEKASMIAAALTDFDARPKDTVMIGDRHFDVVRGEYRLRELAPGRTELTLATTYRISTTVNGYGNLWAHSTRMDPGY